MRTQHTHSHTLAGAVLGVCGFLGNAGLPVGSAHAQDRIFALASGYRNNLTPHEAPHFASKAQLRFGREIPADILSSRALKASLDDPSALRISWGTLNSRPSLLQCEVLLSDGSSLALDAATISPLRLSKSARLSASGDGYRCDIPTHAIRAIRPMPNVEYDRAWTELCSGQSSDDLLAIRRPSGALDTMNGVATALSSTEIEFLVEGETYRVPLGKIEGVVFADTARAARNPTHPDTQGRSYLFTAGSRLVCSRIDVESNRAEGTVAETPCGALITLSPESPFIFDRAEELALTPKIMKVTSDRSFNGDAYTRALPIGEQLLNLAPRSHTVSGEGLNAQLRIFGPTRLEIEVPAGSHTLVLELLRLNALAVPFEMYLQEADSSAQRLIFSTSADAAPQVATTAQGDYRISGPGKIVLVAPSDEVLDFRSFLLVPER